MADTKISALTVATTPLAGTEVLPIVQSGVTKQVSVANLTAGRAVSADSLTLTGSPLPATSGGTGQSSYAVGDLLYASTTTALSKLADVATGNALISGGVGVAPSWGKIGLTTHVSGTLGTGNGGTGLTSFTANGILYASSSSVLATSSSLTYDGFNFVITGTNSGSTGRIELAYSGATKLRFYIASGTNYIDTGDGLNPLAIGTSGAQNILMRVNGTNTWTFDTNQNFVQQIASKGINFTANTGAAGKTSQLLNWYEEGTWTPTDASGGSLSFTGTSGNCYYTRTGNLVTCVFSITYPTTADVNSARVTGLPFTSKSSTNAIAGGQLSFTNYGSFLSMTIDTGGNSFYFWTSAGALVTNATCSGKTFRGVIQYMV